MTDQAKIEAARHLLSQLCQTQEPRVSLRMVGILSTGIELVESSALPPDTIMAMRPKEGPRHLPFPEMEIAVLIGEFQKKGTSDDG